MSIILFFLFPLAVLVAGIGFSSPVLFPPLRRRMRANQQLRAAVITFLSLLTLTFFVWFFAYVPPYTSAYNYLAAGTQPPKQLIQSVTDELWQRRITPPVIRKYCMTGDESICAMADEMEAQDIAPNSNQDWGSYLGMWLMILAPAFVTGYCAYYFTRDNRKQKRE